jgi:hypothetical protein
MPPELAIKCAQIAQLAKPVQLAPEHALHVHQESTVPGEAHSLLDA